MTEGRAPFPCLTLLQYIPSGSLPPSSLPYWTVQFGPVPASISAHTEWTRPSVRRYLSCHAGRRERERRRKESVIALAKVFALFLSFFQGRTAPPACPNRTQNACARSLTLPACALSANEAPFL